MKNKDLRLLYEELKGYLAVAPEINSAEPFQAIYEESIWNQYNQTVELINKNTGNRYERFNIVPIKEGDILPCVRVSAYRLKLSGIISRLKEEYFSDKKTHLTRKINPTPKHVLHEPAWDMLHPKIVKVARSRFESGYFADSVEAAFKEANKTVKHIVKNHTGQEFDGSDLMNKAFSLSNPIIRLDDLSSVTGQNIQKGYLQIFGGAMTGIRNPKAHDNIDIDNKRAIHFLYLASLMMYKIDERI